MELNAKLDECDWVPRARLAPLRRLGIETVGDLLFHFPRSYEDLSEVRPIKDLKEGETQTTQQWNRSGYQRNVIEHLDVKVMA